MRRLLCLRVWTATAGTPAAPAAAAILGIRGGTSGYGGLSWDTSIRMSGSETGRPPARPTVRGQADLHGFLRVEHVDSGLAVFEHGRDQLVDSA